MVRLFVFVVIAFVGMFAAEAAAQCPGGVCPRPYYVAPQPEPIFRAPIRRFWWQATRPRAFYYPAYPAPQAR